MKTTSFAEFEQLASQGTFVPVCKEIMADLLTPVSAFLKIADHSDFAFLLESVEGGEHLGRYSFLGKDPFLILRASRDGRTTIDRAGVTTVSDDPFIPTLRRLMATSARRSFPTCRGSPAGRSASSGTTPPPGSSRCR